MYDFPRDLVKINETTESCPCCYQIPLPLGLFDRNPGVMTPLALQEMLEDQEIGSSLLEGEILYGCGRFFARSTLPLPLARDNTPIKIQVWIEITQLTFDQIRDNIKGLLNKIQFTGSLACDVPGFPGTIGAEVLAERSFCENSAVITACTDGRLDNISPILDHGQMAALYRQVWGNPDSVADADPEMRAIIDSGWENLIQRPAVYRREMTPPAEFAGIKPIEIIIAPPLDTGDEVILATVGCSDVHMVDVNPVELVTWVRNPSDDFIRSFADFGYLSRLNNNPIHSGLIVPELPGIPDTDNRMSGWLLWTPWQFGEERDVIFGPHDQPVQLLAAIPLYELEVIFAQAFGSGKLVKMLLENDIDTADLSRPLAAPTPEQYH